eukprot:g2507.t1
MSSPCVLLLSAPPRASAIVDGIHGASEAEYDDDDAVEPKLSVKAMKKIERRREKAYVELKERKKREKKLSALRSHLQLQKNLSGKGQRRKVKDAQGNRPAVYKWKQRRKR